MRLRRAEFERNLRNLITFCHNLLFLPVLFLKGTFNSTERKTMNLEWMDCRTADGQMRQFQNGTDAATMQRDVAYMDGPLIRAKRDARVASKVVESFLRSGPESALKNPDSFRKAKELRNAVCHLEQQLRVIIEDAEQAMLITDQQLDPTWTIQAQEQQKLSIDIARTQSKLWEETRKDQAISLEIAEASRRIAEETKRDGTSMKALAVVTLVYLPATALSSVLAMPLFDWNAKGEAGVNPRIWVYIVLAVPLTVLSVGLWYLWLRVHRPCLMRTDGKRR